MSRRTKPLPFVMVTVPCAFPRCSATCQARMEIWKSTAQPASVVIIGDSMPDGWTGEDSGDLYHGRDAWDCGYRCPKHPENDAPADGGAR